MRKKTFLYLSLVEIGMVLLTGILSKAGISSSIWGIPFLITALLQAVLFYAGLAKTYQSSDWGWFVAILFSTPLATLFYGILGPNDPQLLRSSPLHLNAQAIPQTLSPEHWTSEQPLVPVSEQIPVTIAEHPNLGR